MRRTDANQAQVMKDLRKMGYLVEDLSQLGGGVPDLLVGTQFGELVLLEVKDGTKPPSKRSLTDDQKQWHSLWKRFQVFVVTSAADAHEKITDWP